MTASQKTILFVTYGGGHAQMVWPVVHALKQSSRFRHNKVRIRTLALPAARDILVRHGVEVVSFADYIDEQQDADALAWGAELAKVHHSPSSGIDLAESIAYLGLSYKDLVLRLGVDEAESSLARQGRRAFFPLTVMSRVFDEVNPDFVVTTNSPRSEAAAIATANLRGIDNLIMTDLFTGLGGYLLEGRNISYLNPVARDMFVEDGLVDESRSVAHFTGNPAFDRLLELPRDPEPGWLSRNFPTASPAEIVLHADAPGYQDPADKSSHVRSDSEILTELDAVWRAAIDNNAVYLVRPHPSQPPELYRDWIDGRQNAFLAADNDLHDLLRNISLLVVRTSTVGLEAVYMGKRVLQLDSDFHSDLPLASMGVAWGVNSFAELGSVVGEALADNDRFARICSRRDEVLPLTPAAQKIARILLDKLR